MSVICPNCSEDVSPRNPVDAGCCGRIASGPTDFECPNEALVKFRIDDTIIYYTLDDYPDAVDEARTPSKGWEPLAILGPPHDATDKESQAQGYFVFWEADGDQTLDALLESIEEHQQPDWL